MVSKCVLILTIDLCPEAGYTRFYFLKMWKLFGFLYICPTKTTGTLLKTKLITNVKLSAMPATLTAIQTKSPLSRSITLNILALLFVYFTPALLQLINLPVYLIEPMRIMLIIVIAQTTQRNAIVLALTLPLFSFLVTSHPVLPKTLIMTAELLVNVWLFYFLSVKLKNYFSAIFLSIIISKVLYIGLKYLLINLQLIDESLISTSIYMQVVTTAVLSFYLAVVLRRREADPDVYVDPTAADF